MKKKLLTAFGALALACSLPLSGLAKEQPFSDVPPSKHFAEAVNELAARHVIGGYPDGTFKPGNPITRGQAAAIIAKMTGLDLSEVKDPQFKDVTTDNGYYKAIGALAEANIIGGYQDGRYGPNDPITRGQLASILVKAFDLPRYSSYDMKNPFKDVIEHQSHGPNIMILYRLGITTGTTPDRFGINQPVTRGQAAKLLKATEELKPAMVSLDADELGVERIHNVRWRTGEDVYEPIVVNGKTGYYSDRLQLVLLKEGTGMLNISVHKAAYPYEGELKKYLVHVQKVNGTLTATLEKTEALVPTEAPLEVSADETVQHVKLTTTDGTPVNENTPWKKCELTSQRVCVMIDQLGSYLAQVKFADGKEVRFSIEATKPKEAQFQYDIKTLREQQSLVFDTKTLFSLNDYYDKEAAQKIGKHTILTENAGDIADITRDPGTNVFRVTPKKVGTVKVDFENEVYWRDGQPGDAITGYTTGMEIKVEELNGLIRVSARPVFTVNSDM